MNDKVNNPKHYTSHPSGVECINITEHYNFCVGNAIKYLWRQGLKEETGYEALDKQIEDCKKAIWYINRHIEGISKGMDKPLTNKEKVDLLNRADKEATKLNLSLDSFTIPPGVARAGFLIPDREMVARATISKAQAPKSWLDCND